MIEVRSRLFPPIGLMRISHSALYAIAAAIICAAVVILPSVASAEDLTVPEIHRRVTDLSATLSSDEISRIEGTLAEFERATSNQIVVLIVPSLEGESLEDYSLAVCEKNKLGKKGKDNGVLLLVAKSDRKLRIEVGYGLEGSLNDATSDQIIRHVIAPRFRSGDYAGGIEDGVQAIMAATKGEFKGDDDAARRRAIPIPLAVFLGLAFLLLRLTILNRRHYITRRGYWGGPWFGGFGGGGFGGGFGGGGGGGGFSGGGGSFGGGGASGGW